MIHYNKQLAFAATFLVLGAVDSLESAAGFLNVCRRLKPILSARMTGKKLLGLGAAGGIASTMDTSTKELATKREQTNTITQPIKGYVALSDTHPQQWKHSSDNDLYDTSITPTNGNSWILDVAVVIESGELPRGCKPIASLPADLFKNKKEYDSVEFSVCKKHTTHGEGVPARFHLSQLTHKSNSSQRFEVALQDKMGRWPALQNLIDDYVARPK